MVPNDSLPPSVATDTSTGRPSADNDQASGIAKKIVTDLLGPTWRDVPSDEAKSQATGSLAERLELWKRQLPIITKRWTDLCEKLSARAKYESVDFRAWQEHLSYAENVGRVLGAIAAPMERTLLKAAAYSRAADEVHGVICWDDPSGAAFSVAAPAGSRLALEHGMADGGEVTIDSREIASAIAEYAELSDELGAVAWESFVLTANEFTDSLLHLELQPALNEIRVRLPF